MRHRPTATTVLLLLAVATLVAVVYRRGRRARTRPRAPVTQATVPLQAGDVELGQPGRNTEARLDEALRETFPASDPIAIHIE